MSNLTFTYFCCAEITLLYNENYFDVCYLQSNVVNKANIYADRRNNFIKEHTEAYIYHLESTGTHVLYHVTYILTRLKFMKQS